MEKLKLGIGVCTRNRPTGLSRTLMSLLQYRNDAPGWNEGSLSYSLFVADDGSDDPAQLSILRSLRESDSGVATNWGTEDSQRVGVAKNKNRILRRFADCDYVVIFEDDAYPVHPDWFKVHIEVSRLSMIHHFNFVPHSKPAHVGHVFGATPVTLADGQTVHVAQTQNITGVFLFYSQRVLRTLGGFDRRFGLYGFEHVEFSDRIRDPRIGLSPPGQGYPSLLECERYICWDDSVPSLFTEEEKRVMEAEQRLLWDRIREDMFLYRPF